MNRNTNSRFSMAPQVSIERSRFDRSCTVKTSFNIGQVVPFFLEEVLPGDTFDVKTSKIARMQTLKTPMMDDIFLDTYYFFVPNRLVWSHWREFMGENSDSEWIPEVNYSIPQITAPSSTGWSVGTVADYLGVRPLTAGISVNALPFRAYALICNDWFRDENLQEPLVIQTGDSTVTGTNSDSYITGPATGGMPFIAAKTHDYFTSCLPAPQKGPDVSISAIEGGNLPVFTVANANDYYFPQGTTITQYVDKLEKSYPVLFGLDGASTVTGNPRTYSPVVPKNEGTSPFVTNALNYSSDATKNVIYGTSDVPWATIVKAEGFDDTTHYINNYTIGALNDANPQTVPVGYQNYHFTTPINLVAKSNAVYTSINELRMAFQVQRFYEKCARGGTRYIELIKSHFGVTSPDARMMRPEYLGGNRLPLNVKQITQTGATTGTEPLGNVAGMSVTTDSHKDFVKSFTEHGYIIGVCVARYHHTYQQGTERTFWRKNKFDYYWPVFAHIGEQAVYNRELYTQGTSDDALVFGYQEAWADYRYKPNRVSGMMRSDANTALDTWHLGDDYSQLPILSNDWIHEDLNNVDRVLAINSSTANQVFADILVQNYATRPMPMYSIPGLIDHF